MPELKSGDIGAVAKLNISETGDSISLRNAPILYHGPKLSEPFTFMAYRAEQKADEDKLSTALQKMMDEDRTIRLQADPENRQSLIYAIGEQQLEVLASRLRIDTMFH